MSMPALPGRYASSGGSGGIVTREVRGEIAGLEQRGTRVIVVTPTSEDLALIGVNLMNPLRRIEVLDTARRTSIPQLRAQLALAG